MKDSPMKPSTNSLGQTEVQVPSGRHPASHFERERTSIEPSDNGGFSVHHHMRLKKKFEGQRHMEGGYREPEHHVFPHAAAMHEHLKEVYKGGSKSENEGAGKSSGTDENV